MKISTIRNYSNYANNIQNQKNSRPSFGEKSGAQFMSDDLVYIGHRAILQANPQGHVHDVLKLAGENVTETFWAMLNCKYIESQKSDLKENIESLKCQYAMESSEYERAKILNTMAEAEKNSRNDEKMEGYTKLCKKLMKSPYFSPNAEYFGESLVEKAIANDDKEMAIALIRHKDFKKPTTFKNPFCKKEYDELEKKSHSILSRIFC